jgi:multidrug efflux pump subunit AcrA (membrane-fusion protein)
MMQQGEAQARKQQALDAAERQAAELRAQLAVAGSEKAKAEEAAAETKRQLAEAQELLRSNQQVIQWLNKELNDTQAGTRAHSAAALLAAAKGSAFRPSFPRPGSVERPPSMAACDAAATSSSPPPLAPPAGGSAGFRSELRSKAALAALGESASGAGETSARVVGFNEYLAPSIATSC